MADITNIEFHTKTGAPAIIIPKKKIILDATVMNSVLGCGRFTDFRFNHNFHSINGKSNSLEVGSLVHKVIEVYNKHLLKKFNRQTSISNGLIAGELYANGCKWCADWTSTDIKPPCGHEPQEYPGVKNTPEMSSGNYVGWRYALQTCEEYFKFYESSHWVTLEAEVVKKKILYEDDEIEVGWKAKLDMVVDTNQGIYPVDIKTMKQRREKVRLNNQFIGQCLVMDVRNMFVDNIGFQTSLKPEEKYTREMMSYSADLLNEWQNETLPFVAYKLLEWTETGYWPPNYTHCVNNYGNCPFISVCESDRNMREDTLRMGFVKGPRWDPRNADD